MLCPDCLVEMKTQRGAVTCPSCGNALVPDDAKATQRSSRPVLRKLLFLVTTVVAVTVAASFLFIQISPSEAGTETTTDPAGSKSPVRTDRALNLPADFTAQQVELQDDMVYVRASTQQGRRRIIAFDRAGELQHQIPIPLAPDWDVRDFVPVGETDIMLAGRTGENVFLARIDGSGALDWARLEPAHLRAPGPIEVIATDDLVHALLPGPGARQRSVAAYGGDGVRLWRRPLPGLAADGHASITVSAIGAPIVLAPIDAGAGKRRGQFKIHRLSGNVELHHIGPAAMDYQALGVAQSTASETLTIERIGDEFWIRVRDAAGNKRAETALPAAQFDEIGVTSVTAAADEILFGPIAETQKWARVTWDSTGHIEHTWVTLPPSLLAVKLTGVPGTQLIRVVSKTGSEELRLWEGPLAETSTPPVATPVFDTRVPEFSSPIAPADETTPTLLVRGMISEHASAAKDENKRVFSEAAPEPIDVHAPEDVSVSCTFTCAPEDVPAATYPITTDVSGAQSVSTLDRPAQLADTHAEACLASGGVPVQSAAPVCSD